MSDILTNAEALAYFKFYPAERDLALETMEDYLRLLDGMSEFRTEAEPMISPRKPESALRADTAEKSVTREEMLKDAPQAVDCYFSAPQTFD